jgi:hypothetical protein
VPTWSPIVLQFSKPMDTNSVQSAFSISPSVNGAFSWSPANNTVTFTPGAAGMPGLSSIVVRVTNSAIDAVSGNALFAPYELKFKTAASSFHDTNPPTVFVQTPTNGTVNSANLAISGTATDDLAVAKVEVQIDNSAWLTAGGTTVWSVNLNSSNFLNGPHSISARATDTTGNVSPTSAVSVKFSNVPGNYLQRMSGGNPANVTDCGGSVWLADAAYTLGAFGYVGGTAGYVANSIIGICSGAQPLYQREHYSTSSGGFYYEFDCPAGVYETTLLEAETYWTAPGKRVFNVFIQGRQVLTNFDIYAAAGGQNIPLSRVFTSAVTNSQLQILFIPVIDNARVSGVQVRKIADVYSDTDGIPDWWRLAYFGHALGQAGDLSRGTDDADGDGMSNASEYLAGTNPQDASSRFVITDFNLGSGSNVQVSCSAVSNHTYQLLRCDGLAGVGGWVSVGTPLSAVSNSVRLVDPAGPTNSVRLYRVQTQ